MPQQLVTLTLLPGLASPAFAGQLLAKPIDQPSRSGQGSMWAGLALTEGGTALSVLAKTTVKNEVAEISFVLPHTRGRTGNPRFASSPTLPSSLEPPGKEVAVTLGQRWIGNVTIIDIDGRVTDDDDAYIILRDTLKGLVMRGRLSLLVNLQGAPSIDSAALGGIAAAYASATRQGGSLKLLHVSARVHALLVVTRLLSLFEIFDSEAEALTSFATPPV